MKKKYKYGLGEGDVNYCIKCWREFTTLTEIERNNMNKMLKIQEEKYYTSPIYCETNGKTYNSQTEASIDLGISRSLLQYYLKNRAKNPKYVFRFI